MIVQKTERERKNRTKEREKKRYETWEQRLDPRHSIHIEYFALAYRHAEQSLVLTRCRIFRSHFMQFLSFVFASSILFPNLEVVGYFALFSYECICSLKRFIILQTMKQSLYRVLAFPELFCVYPSWEYKQQQQKLYRKWNEIIYLLFLPGNVWVKMG